MSKRKTLLASEIPVFEEEHEIIDDVAEKRRRASGSLIPYLLPAYHPLTQYVFKLL